MTQTTKLLFPIDFVETSHPVVYGAKQWLPKIEQYKFISIVGGGKGLYGDGVNTFEIMVGDDVIGYQTEKGINVILSNL